MCVVARKKVCILFWQKCTFNNDVHTLVCCFYSINALLASPKEREKGSLFFINSIKVQPLLFKGIWNLIQLWTYVHFMEQEMKKKITYCGLQTILIDMNQRLPCSILPYLKHNRRQMVPKNLLHIVQMTLIVAECENNRKILMLYSCQFQNANIFHSLSHLKNLVLLLWCWTLGTKWRLTSPLFCSFYWIKIWCAGEHQISPISRHHHQPTVKF